MPPDKPPTQYIRPSGFDAHAAPHLPKEDWTPDMMCDLARQIRAAHPDDPAVRKASQIMVSLVNACVKMQRIIDREGLLG
jgi:hypothetical protein